jgi:hypothetical protein
MCRSQVRSGRPAAPQMCWRSAVYNFSCGVTPGVEVPGSGELVFKDDFNGEPLCLQPQLGKATILQGQSASYIASATIQSGGRRPSQFASGTSCRRRLNRRREDAVALELVRSTLSPRDSGRSGARPPHKPVLCAAGTLAGIEAHLENGVTLRLLTDAMDEPKARSSIGPFSSESPLPWATSCVSGARACSRASPPRIALRRGRPSQQPLRHRRRMLRLCPLGRPQRAVVEGTRCNGLRCAASWRVVLCTRIGACSGPSARAGDAAAALRPIAR